MNNFFANLGAGGGDKNKKDGGANNSSWKGGSGDMDSIKKKNPSSGSKKNNTAGSGDAKTGFNAFTKNATDALGKMDLFNQNKNANPRGGGKSLGGTAPGKVLSVSLDKPGSLGMEVEKRKNSQATTIIAAIVPNSQADNAGLKRGDIVCRAGSNGAEEISYDQFLAMAKSGRRPLRFDVRRIESSILSGGNGGKSTGGRVSADSVARKQAVIAAAEAREAKHKTKQKPIAKTEKRMDGLTAKQQQYYQHDQTEDSEETRRAVAAAKQAEQDDVKNMGYNPYEAKAMTSGQARNATVAMTQGEINAGNAPSKIKGGSEQGMPSPGRVNEPEDPLRKQNPPSPEFEQAFSTVVTTNTDHDAVLKSLGIMRKLIQNAVTKGQEGDDESSAKFRRVRLSNAKIKAAITDIAGALELMMSVGFVLSENDEDGETYLVFPPGEQGKDWLDSALGIME